MLIKYIFIGSISAIISAFCMYFTLTLNLFGGALIYVQNNNNNNPYTNNDRFENNPYIYKDSYYAYRNWKVKVSNILNYKTGSLIAITNTRNPVTVTMEDDDSDKLKRITVSRLGMDISVTCNTNRVGIYFDEFNEIKSINLYEGLQVNNRPKYRIKLTKENGKWIISEKKEENCI